MRNCLFSLVFNTHIRFLFTPSTFGTYHVSRISTEFKGYGFATAASINRGGFYAKGSLSLGLLFYFTYSKVVHLVVILFSAS